MADGRRSGERIRSGSRLEAHELGKKSQDINRAGYRSGKSRFIFEFLHQVPDNASEYVDRYSALPSVGQRLDFLLTIQLPILDLYRLRISSFLDGFESVSASFVRAVPGAISRDPSRAGGENNVKRETTGLGGVQKLCKALISTKYISKAMRCWGDEVVSKTFGPSRVQSPDVKVIVLPGTADQGHL